MSVTPDNFDDDVLLQGANQEPHSDTVSFATVTVWAYLIPNLYVTFAEFIIAAKRCQGISLPGTIEAVEHALRLSYVINIAIGFTLYIVSNIVVSILTTDMDRRAADICIGLSRLFAGIVFAVLSVNIAQWFGVYHSRKRKIATYRSIREIRFAQSWSLWKQISAMYFFNLYFSCRTQRLSDLYGLLVGVTIGCLIVYFTSLARTLKKGNQKKYLTIVIIILMVVASVLCTYAGLYFIAFVWFEDSIRADEIALIGGAAVWSVICIGVHLSTYYWTRKHQKRGNSTRFKSVVFQQNPIPRFKLNQQGSKHNDQDNDQGMGKDEQDIDNNGNVDNDDAGNDVNDKPILPAEPPQTIVAGVSDAEVALNDDGVEGSSRRKGVGFSGSVEVLNDNVEGSSRRKGVGFSDTEVVLNDDVEGPDHGEVSDEKEAATEKAEDYIPPTVPALFGAKLYETYPWLCCCLKKYKEQHQPVPRQSLMRPDQRTRAERVFDGFKRLMWYLLSGGFLYLTIVNVGATIQQSRTKDNLGYAFEILYPPDYNTGEMCAWDKPGPDANFTTFSSVEEVALANFTIVHCGACGACSNWNDVGIQWTTREDLAKESQQCAKVSLFGSEADVDQCNMDRLGFTYECARCWTFDEINTKEKCVFIYLQALISNRFTNFEVGFFDITSAACDEARSGPEFVPCVGANRRRMNIVSDIRRPKSQQCTVVTYDWTEIFGDPYAEPPIPPPEF